MPQKEINGITVDVNEEGYLTDFSQWNEDVAKGIASEEDIELTDDHWKVVKYLQEQHTSEVALSIRRIKKSGVISVKDLYKLFPKGPLKLSTKIAGIPKPASCV
ncbi:MAG: TusE/DsrC/DsvC family sulfur relay protein [Bacteroidetes bacterium]|nr:TusE/DsrC/DsvC family sulfur relay protein [Bacteroidota bacterium]